MKVGTEDKIRKLVGARDRESTLDAVRRFKRSHEQKLNKMRRRLHGPKHKYLTVSRVAYMARVSENKVRQDIERGLLAHNGIRKIPNAPGPVLVFKHREVAKYIEYLDSFFGRHRQETKAEKVTKYAEAHGDQAAAIHFGIKLSSVRQSRYRVKKRKREKTKKAEGRDVETDKT